MLPYWVTKTMPARRRTNAKPAKPLGLPSPTQRTRIGNGKQLFLTENAVDERSAPARRFREVFAQIISDIGGDPSEAQVQIARRAASLCVWAESAEAELAKGNAIDIASFTTAANSLRRLLADLGLERKLRDVTPTLDEYLRSRHHATADADEAA